MSKFISILICTTLAGLMYVYTEVEAVKIGYDIRKQQEIKTQALDQSRALQYNIARLKAPQTLEKKLLAQRIELKTPASWQTLVMQDGRMKPSEPSRLSLIPKPFDSRFFIGTARAEAKENR